MWTYHHPTVKTDDVASRRRFCIHQLGGLKIPLEDTTPLSLVFFSSKHADAKARASLCVFEAP